MKRLQTLVFALVALTAAAVVGGFFLPAKYEVERSIDIRAPATLIFGHVNDLTKNPAWSPWQAADPEQVITYGPVTTGVGAHYRWRGQKTGTGTLRIVESHSPSRIECALQIGDHNQARVHWHFVPQGEFVHTTWRMTGDVGKSLIGRYLGLFMDEMVGDYFDDGLRRLKAVAEAAPGDAVRTQSGDDAHKPASGASANPGAQSTARAPSQGK